MIKQLCYAKVKEVRIVPPLSLNLGLDFSLVAWFVRLYNYFVQPVNNAINHYLCCFSSISHLFRPYHHRTRTHLS